MMSARLRGSLNEADNDAIVVWVDKWGLEKTAQIIAELGKLAPRPKWGGRKIV
jgi:hypothetical protein